MYTQAVGFAWWLHINEILFTLSQPCVKFFSMFRNIQFADIFSAEHSEERRSCFRKFQRSSDRLCSYIQIWSQHRQLWHQVCGSWIIHSYIYVIATNMLSLVFINNCNKHPRYSYNCYYYCYSYINELLNCFWCIFVCSMNNWLKNIFETYDAKT